MILINIYLHTNQCMGYLIIVWIIGAPCHCTDYWGPLPLYGLLGYVIVRIIGVPCHCTDYTDTLLFTQYRDTLSYVLLGYLVIVRIIGVPCHSLYGLLYTTCKLDIV